MNLAVALHSINISHSYNNQPGETARILLNYAVTRPTALGVEVIRRARGERFAVSN